MGSLLERPAHPTRNLHINETFPEGQSLSRHSELTQFAGPVLRELEENEEEISERLQDISENLGLSAGEGQNTGTHKKEVGPPSQGKRPETNSTPLR